MEDFIEGEIVISKSGAHYEIVAISDESLTLKNLITEGRAEITWDVAETLLDLREYKRRKSGSNKTSKKKI